MEKRTDEDEVDISDARPAHDIGIGRCGCGKGCGVVHLGFKDCDGKVFATHQLHWSEVGPFIRDLMDLAVLAKMDEEEYKGVSKPH